MDFSIFWIVVNIVVVVVAWLVYLARSQPEAIIRQEICKKFIEKYKVRTEIIRTSHSGDRKRYILYGYGAHPNKVEVCYPAFSSPNVECGNEHFGDLTVGEVAWIADYLDDIEYRSKQEAINKTKKEVMKGITE